MFGLLANTPENTYREFTDHLNFVLSKTITQARLVQVGVGKGATLSFRQNENSSVNISPVLRLSLNQTLIAARTPFKERIRNRRFRLRTVKYYYKLMWDAEDQLQEPLHFRWEYESSRLSNEHFPRHHFQAPVQLPFGRGAPLDLNRLHIPTGYVTIEGIIRFILTEFSVKPLADDWDQVLKESEGKFRQWTGLEM